MSNQDNKKIDDPLDIFEPNYAKINAEYQATFSSLFVYFPREKTYKIIFEEIAVELYHLLLELVACDELGIPTPNDLAEQHEEVFNFMHQRIAENRRIHRMEVEHGL